VLNGWIEVWSPHVLQAVAALGDLFASAPEPIPAADVVAAVQAEQDRTLAALGLSDAPGPPVVQAPRQSGRTQRPARR
jgi:hypothetical protein